MTDMPYRLITSVFLIFASLVAIPFSTPAKPAPKYHLMERIPIGGEGGWDILSVDAKHRRLYISHSTRVDVVDITTNKVIGQIKNTEGVHAVGIADEFGHGFTTNGKTNSVLMFDLATLDTLARIPVGQKPDAIAYEPSSKKMLVMNGKSEDISVLDPKKGAVLHTVKLGGGPEYAVPDGRGNVYVNLEDASEVLTVSTKTWSVTRRSSVKPGEGPTGIAMDTKTNRLFIGCGNSKMIAVDSKSGKVVATLPTGKGIDAAVFDPATKLAMTSNGAEGTVSIYKEESPNKYRLVQTLSTQRGARTMALDPVTHDIFVVTAEFGPAPAATSENPHPRPTILPNSFVLLRYGME
jgi:YVTN family beta-propeller protein